MENVRGWIWLVGFRRSTVSEVWYMLGVLFGIGPREIRTRERERDWLVRALFVRKVERECTICDQKKRIKKRKKAEKK